MLWEKLTRLDQGLEKIPEELKKEAWEKAKEQFLEQKESNYQELFNKYYQDLRRHENLAVSSQAEAYRLFVAAQIIDRLFLAPIKEDYNWSHLAKELVNNLERNFQNYSRPVAPLESSAEESLTLVLEYYFPSEQARENLELALENKLPIGLDLSLKKPKLIKKQELFLQKVQKVQKERDLIEKFLSYKSGRQENPPALSEKVLAILESYFQENQEKYEFSENKSFKPKKKKEKEKEKEKEEENFSNCSWS